MGLTMSFDKSGVLVREFLPELALASLGAGTVLKSTAQVAFEEDFRLLKTEYLPSIDGLAAGESIILGLADNNLSVAEIAEAIQLNGPINRNQNVEKERARRPVWLLATIGADVSGLGVAVPNQGMPIVWKKRWTFSKGTGQGFVFFVINPDDSALSAAAQKWHYRATHFGVWV